MGCGGDEGSLEKCGASDPALIVTRIIVITITISITTIFIIMINLLMSLTPVTRAG